MHTTRIAELLEPFLGLTDDQRLTTDDPNRISTYIDLLLRWNARINLTAIRNEEEIVTRHFGESLFAARHLFPKVSSVPPVTSVVKDFDVAEARSPEPEARVADLGSGAGFPGIPIKLWAPHIALTLIESNHKKATFLREVTRVLTLTNVNIFPGRAAQLLQQQPVQEPAPQSPASPRHPRSRFDLVTLRAVEDFDNVLPIAANLVCPGGRLALLIGSSQLDRVHSLLPTIAWDDPLPVPQSESRTLLIGRRMASGQP